MDIGEVLSRFNENLAGRIHGPMTFRFILQPTMAAIAAFKSGMRDYREGRSPYFWSLVKNPSQRSYLIHEGWKDVFRIFCLGIVMDLIYQITVFRWFFPMEALVIALVLPIVPYLLLRGIITRIANVRRAHGRI